MVVEVPRVHHRYVGIDGVRVFYREAGPPDALTLLLPHGFPSASHQYRRLIDALGTRFHLIAPDRPGFGHTDIPPGFRFTFDSLADVTERFAQRLRLARFVLYLFDFGGPVGFRPTARHPGTVTGLMIQNANAYQDGLSDLAQEMIGNRPDVEGAEERIRQIGLSVVDQSPRLRVAVIGATGHLGGAVAGDAAARGHQVTPTSGGSSSSAEAEDQLGLTTTIQRTEDGPMQDRTLYRLTYLAAAMSLGHHVDHVIRHNAVGWPLTDQVNAFTMSLVIYPVIATGLLLYRAGRVGPGFWALVSGGGAVFVSAVHFGPFAVEPPEMILAAYHPPILGWLAFTWLAIFVAVLAVTSVYETRLWWQQRLARRGARPAPGVRIQQ